MICGGIVNTLQPSWPTSLPSEFGSAGYGKLKADQRHVLGTIFLPVSLVHLWSVVEAGNPHSERCCQILDVTMSLLSAVAAACSWVTSVNHAWLYLSSMHSYLRGFKALFPNYSLHPNHQWPFTFPSTFYCIALSIPGGHSLLSGSLVYPSASLQIIKLVGSIIWSFHPL